MRSKLATLKAEKEIAKHEAKMRVYEQFVNTDDVSLNRYEPFLSLLKQSDDSISKQELKKKSSLNPEAESFKTRELDKSVKQPRVNDHKNIIPDHKNNLLNTISNLLKLQSAPEISIDTFSGDPLEFKYFMATFEEVIESKINEARGRLTRLIQYTSGEAKDLVKGCIYLKPNSGYKKAKELLEKRFGDPHRVLSAYRKELRLWKSIKPADAVALRKLYTFLVKTSDIIINHFDSPDNICLVVSKLPGSLQDRWNRKVHQIHTKSK